MRVVECRSEAGLLELRRQWGELMELSLSDTIFLTWEWVSAWWEAYGIPGELNILLAFDEKDVLRGIAPLRRRTIRRYGRDYPTLSFIGDGSADSDYLDFVIRAGDEAVVLEAFSGYWQDQLRRGTLLTLNTIPDSSPNLPVLRELGNRSGMVWSETAEPCSVVRMAGDWQAYLKQLAPRFRTKVRSVLRNLESRSEASFSFCERADELDRLLPALFDLHQRRWAKASKPGVFRGEQKRLFYRLLSPLLLERGWLGFSSVEWNGQIISSQYGFRYRNRYLQLQEGYDPACEHLNPGAGLRAWSIQQLLKDGVTEYDFLGGTGRHKSDWGAVVTLSKNIVLGGAQPANILFCQGPAWMLKARQTVKHLVPARVLAARDADQERKRIAHFQAVETGMPDTDSAKQWVRNTMASCYCRSPLPSLLMPFRDRYQIQVSRKGALPKISFEERSGPSVRILYFHRVNDEGDPFFPSMPTALFEQEMRFISRRYKVVSLGDAVRRLAEGGPPEPVISITFDDGYQDNFLNAFPILQRYGLPATIFLTTGSIDSREPLWFERLALAFKKTSLESIDLEIDIPRRLWMRTEAERLQANDELYTVLRGLADEQRQEWLSEILSRLGGQEGRERNDKMLTWEQTRHMQKHGVDFGGHTVNHPFVSRLRPEQGGWEISECKRRIEAELQVPVKHFAYPSGREQDVAEWNKKLVQQAGYEAAVSTKWGLNNPDTDRLEMRRGGPWEEHPALFAAKLDWYQWVNG